MKAWKIIVTDDRFASYKEERAVLKEIGADLEVHDCRSPQELLTAARGADGILANLFPLPGELIRQLKGCKIISRYGVGYDNVDVPAATAAGIWVSIVPDYGIGEVSDHSLGMLLGLVRKLTNVHRRVQAGEWNVQQSLRIPRTQGKVIGLVGYGRIGRSMHRKIEGFDFGRILVTDPYVDPALITERGAEPVKLEVLLAEADFISIHACLNEQTRHLIGEQELALMKSTALLINTSRGPIIDEQALCQALTTGQIAGAGLDVFESEPLPPDHPLLGLENVLLTSHMAYHSEESIVELKTKAARNIVAVLQGKPPLYPVNRLEPAFTLPDPDRVAHKLH